MERPGRRHSQITVQSLSGLLALRSPQPPGVRSSRQIPRISTDEPDLADIITRLDAFCHPGAGMGKSRFREWHYMLVWQAANK